MRTMVATSARRWSMVAMLAAGLLFGAAGQASANDDAVSCGAARPLVAESGWSMPPQPGLPGRPF